MRPPFCRKHGPQTRMFDFWTFFGKAPFYLPWVFCFSLFLDLPSPLPLFTPCLFLLVPPCDKQRVAGRLSRPVRTFFLLFKMSGPLDRSRCSKTWIIGFKFLFFLHFYGDRGLFSLIPSSYSDVFFARGPPRFWFRFLLLNHAVDTRVHSRQPERLSVSPPDLTLPFHPSRLRSPWVPVGADPFSLPKAPGIEIDEGQATP